MSAFASTRRITRQLRHDPRTVGLVLVVPALLLTLLYYVFSDAPTLPGQPALFDRVGPIMLAILPMMLMFVVTSVVMLRERTSGTLERLLTTPVSRWNLIASYALVFGALAIVQAGLLAALILGPMGVDVEGPTWVLLTVALLDAIFGVAFGLLASAFARTEFQAVQFMPLFIGPQIFLCGLLVAKEHMPDVLAAIAEVLPMTWAVDVVVEAQSESSISGASWLRLGVLATATLAALLVASATMSRSTK